jgi:hypothetical protein
MINRKPLAPNNRNASKLMREFGVSEAFYIKYPKNGERQSIFTWARAGRAAQDDGASGGGRIVGR